jgi:hypothetical protein
MNTHPHQDEYDNHFGSRGHTIIHTAAPAGHNPELLQQPGIKRDMWWAGHDGFMVRIQAR